MFTLNIWHVHLKTNYQYMINVFISKKENLYIYFVKKMGGGGEKGDKNVIKRVKNEREEKPTCLFLFL